MGGGDVVPDESLNSAGEVTSFTGRETELAAGDSSDGVSSVGVDGSIGEYPAEKWGDSSVTPPRVFAANLDKGYSVELASHFDSLSNSDLESEVETVQTMDDSFAVDESRFVGGVAASRSGVDFTASDMYDVAVNSDAVSDIDGFSESELVDELERRFDKTFEQLDDYVAGKVAVNIGTVEVDTIQITPDGRPIEVVDGADENDVLEMNAGYSANKRELVYSPAAIAEVDDGVSETDVVAHEIGHAVEASFNADTSTTTPMIDGLDRTERVELFAGRDYEYVKRDELTGGESEYTAPHAEEFREGVLDVTRELRDTYTAINDVVERGGDPTPDVLRGEVANPQIPLRTYQLTKTSESFAVGFAGYSRDVLNMLNNQSGMVEHIDEYVTGNGWREVNPGEVTASGVGIDRPSKSSTHIPSDIDESNVGEIIRVERTDGSEVVGHAVDAGTDELVVVGYGSYVSVSTDEVERVRERQWN